MGSCSTSLFERDFLTSVSNLTHVSSYKIGPESGLVICIAKYPPRSLIDEIMTVYIGHESAGSFDLSTA